MLTVAWPIYRFRTPIATNRRAHTAEPIASVVKSVTKVAQSAKNDLAKAVGSCMKRSRVCWL
jgi:hypothetical protein